MQRSDVTFESDDEICAAWLYEADSSSSASGGRSATGGDGGTPCVVMAHGFGSTRREGLSSYAERFAAAGLAVLVFDYRTFGDSSGEPRENVNVRHQIEDWQAAIRYARNLPNVDAERIALWGTSFSGGHVVSVAGDDPRIAAVVAQAPFADGIPTALEVPIWTTLRVIPLVVLDLIGSRLGYGPTYLPSVGPPGSVAAMTAPEAEPGAYSLVGPGSKWRNRVTARSALQTLPYRPVRRAALLRMPVLVCVAANDQITPPKAARQLAHLAPQAELLEYPIEHFEIYHRNDVKAAQVDFLKRTLAV